MPVFHSYNHLAAPLHAYVVGSATIQYCLYGMTQT